MNPSDHSPLEAPPSAMRRGVLDWVEWLGNKLPEPALLFAILCVLVIGVSVLGTWLQWRVQPVQLRAETAPVLDELGQPALHPDGSPKQTLRLDKRGKPITRLEPAGKPIEPRSLLTGEGVYWMITSMLKNFTMLPALPLIFVAMLGIGVAEKFGLFAALMRFLALGTPAKLLTPVVIFLGANSSVASDAGYVILPPLAAALFHAVGRHPIAGLAAAFCGVSGGFGGGFFPTAGDGFLAGVATQAAHILDPSYPDLLATHNLYFKMGSALVVTLCGWYVTDRIVEPRLLREVGRGDDVKLEGKSLAELALTTAEKRGLAWAGVANVAVVGLFAAMVLVPGWPLHGRGLQTLASGRALAQQPVVVYETVEAAVAAGVRPERIIDEAPLAVAEGPGKPRLVEAPGDRWAQAIVPLIFFAFVIPGVIFGWLNGGLRNQRDFMDAFHHGIRSIVPVLGIMFFLGQFVNYFQYTGLDRMLAYAGGALLVSADLPIPILVVLFVLLVIGGDFAISGMLSKFGILAPIFIPMFMMVGISPALTTAAYRIGDSVVNVITPMNSYLLVILMVLQKYKPSAGIGTQISLMVPYSAILFVGWTGFLLLWYVLGFELGTQAPLHYAPGH